MNLLNDDEKYEAFQVLLESRLNRQLSDLERDKVRWLASSSPQNFHIFRNIFGELGSHREDN
jgi:hypothetical protein